MASGLEGKCVTEKTALRGLYCVRCNENWGALVGEGWRGADRGGGKRAIVMAGGRFDGWNVPK